LKLGSETPAPTPAPAPAQEPAPAADAAPDLGLDATAPATGEAPAGGNDKPFDDQPFDAGVEASEESDPKKFIEQLTGKLGQSLRKYNETQGQPDLELEKFAINSLLSASHTGTMDAEDQSDIIKKVETAGTANAETKDDKGDEDKGDDVDDSQAPGADAEAPTGESPAAAAEAPAAGAEAPAAGGEGAMNEMSLNDNNAQQLVKIYDNGSDQIKQVLTRLVSFSSKVNRNEFLNDLKDEIDYEDLQEIFAKLKEYGVEKPSVQEGQFFLDNPKKNNMFQLGSNDMLEAAEETEENLPIEENTCIFADKESIKSILKEYFNQEEMPAPAPEKPKTAPTTKPSTPAPSKPSRRDKPFQPVVTPGVRPDPKALDEAKYDYPLYHEIFANATYAGKKYAEDQGYRIDMNDWDDIIGAGPSKPDAGKSNRYSIPLWKSNKLSKKQLHMQIYGMGSKYELNCYIQ
jgi:hypothetical protein